MIRKRSVAIAGHRTSISIEDPFWEGLGAIARARTMTLPALIAEIDGSRAEGVNLSSALRLAVLAWYRDTETHAARRDGDCVGDIA